MKVFLGSGTFILASAAIYWFVSDEPAGTILLVGTAFATYVMAVYAWRKTRRSAEPVEDRGDADPGEGAGDPVASYTMGSPWPFVFGVGVAVLAGGLVFGPALLALGAILVVIAVVGLMRESIA